MTGLLPMLCVLVTPRERDVLRELCRDGGNNRELARRLYVSENTLKTILARVTRKLPIEYHTRTALALGVVRGTVHVRVIPSTQSS